MTSTTIQNGMHDVRDSRTVPPLGMKAPAWEAAAASVVKDISNYYETVQDRPVIAQIPPGYLQKLLPTQAPEEGESWDAIRSDIESKIMPGITHWQSQKYMAFFPASSTYPGILAEMWSSALTAANFNWICSPAVTELETIVMDWMAKALALPDGFTSKGRGGGVIQGSASEAVATAMIAARERYVNRIVEKEHFATDEAREDRKYELRSKMVHVTSDQTHSGAQKATIITGVRHHSIKTSAHDNFSLSGSTLRSALEEVKSRGLRPFMTTITIGTTNTCSVDNLSEIAAVKRDFPDLWIHVDAAYAGAALVCEEYQHLSAQLSAFDSFEVNMHKWLLTNFDCACFYVQDRRDLTDALSITPAYLRNTFSESGLVTDYRDWQIPLGRRFRALKIWFVVRTYGLNGMREHIRHHVRLGELFASLVRGRSDLFEIVAVPAFALTVLAVKPRPQAVVGESAKEMVGSDEQAMAARLKEANEVTKEVYSLIDKEGEFFLTASVIGGVYAIRVVSANPLAEERYVRICFDVIVDATERVLHRRATS